MMLEHRIPPVRPFPHLRAAIWPSPSEAAAAVVNAGGALTRLSVEDPSLDAIYNRYFQDQGARNEAA